jgi:hypothetical protein
MTRNHEALKPLAKIAERDFIFHDGETANQVGDADSQWGARHGHVVGPGWL